MEVVQSDFLLHCFHALTSEIPDAWELDRKVRIVSLR